MAAVLFVFPVVFVPLFFWSRFRERPEVLWRYLAPVLLIGGFGYLGLTGLWDPTGLLAMEPNTLNIFLAVVFITSPTVFRIVRGLTLDIKTRDYVAAAQTRGERPVVHHDVGDPAERPRPADRRCLPAHRLHHDPARHARLLRPRRQPGDRPTGARRSTRGASSCASTSTLPCPRRSPS